MLFEQGVLKLAIGCVEAPFEAGLYSHDDISIISGEAADTAVLEHAKLGKLAMRLARHILRDQSNNKLKALPYLPALLELLPCGWGASECLTELFTDNDMGARACLRVHFRNCETFLAIVSLASRAF